MPYPTFTQSGVTTVVLSRADQWPRPVEGDEGQLTGQTAAAVVRIATLRPPVEFLTLNYTGEASMTQTDYVALAAFLKDPLVNFRALPFTFTDVDSASYTVRYWSGFYQLQRVAVNAWQGRIQLRIEPS